MKMLTTKQQSYSLVREHVREGMRLAILAGLEMHYGALQHATQRRVNRQKWLAQIKEYAEPLRYSDGYFGDEYLEIGTPVVALICWSRDCDMCEGTTRRLVKATVAAIESAMDRDFEWAEGPVRHWLERPSVDFEPEFRDRAMEAYEDGHPHVIFG